MPNGNATIHGSRSKFWERARKTSLESWCSYYLRTKISELIRNLNIAYAVLEQIDAYGVPSDTDTCECGIQRRGRSIRTSSLGEKPDSAKVLSGLLFSDRLGLSYHKCILRVSLLKNIALLSNLVLILQPRGAHAKRRPMRRDDAVGVDPRSRRRGAFRRRRDSIVDLPLLRTGEGARRPLRALCRAASSA